MHCNLLMPLLALCAAQDGDEGVALESCEFWLAFMDAEVG